MDTTGDKHLLNMTEKNNKNGGAITKTEHTMGG